MAATVSTLPKEKENYWEEPHVIVGSHVSIGGKKMLLGSAEEAAVMAQQPL